MGTESPASVSGFRVVPTSAGGGVEFFTEPPVKIDTTTMRATATTVPMPKDTNIIGEGCPRLRSSGELVASDKDINRHEYEECCQVRDGEVKEAHGLGDVGAVLASVAIQPQ